MPRIDSAPKDRPCLVCGGTTNVAHMGLDMCRACTVFYRRSVGNEYLCRSNTNSCFIGPNGVNCRKCRLELIEKLLAGTLKVKPSSSGDSQNGSEPCPDDIPIDRLSLTSAHRPVLKRLRRSSKRMCELRFIGELNLRADPPHPMDMKKLENWAMIMNFFFRFRPFEATYRADKAFPDRLDCTMGGYTTYISREIVDGFLTDCPNVASTADVNRLMLRMFEETFVSHRVLIARLKPRHEEFLAIIGIMFWTLEGDTVSEAAIKLSEKYRATIMRELHVYYREELRMNDYAARLGELLTLVQIFEKSEDTKEFFELLRLMGVFTDDTFSYKLIKQ